MAAAASRRSRFPALWWAGASLIVCLFGCGPRPAADRLTIVVGTAEDFETVNELIAQGSSFNDAIIDRFMLQLVEEQPDSQDSPATFKGRLAESWEFSPDRKRLTFRLRRDAMWSDGQPVTADDVRFSWQAHISPDVGWSYAFVKEAIEDVEVVDSHTVRFHFSAASSTQLEDVNEGVILPRHVWSQLPFADWRQQPQWFLDNLVANGPFLFESWEPQQRVVLVRNPTYFEPGLPRADRIIFQYVEEPANLLGQLLSGQVDIVPQVRPADIQRIRQHQELKLLSYQTRQYTFVTWNTLRPQFQDPEVRRALTLAVDRQMIVDTLHFGFATVGSSPITSSFWAHNEAIEPWAYDLAEARRLLEQRGWVDSNGDGTRDRDGVELRFELTTNTGDPTRWDAAQMIQAQLREAGVEATPRRVEYKTLNALNFAHDYDATVASFLMDTTLDLGYAFHSRSIDGGLNFGSYRNVEVDRLIDEVNATLDPLATEPLLHRIQEIVHQEQPMLFLWEPQRLLALRSELANVAPNMLSEYWRLREWTKSAVVPGS